MFLASEPLSPQSVRVLLSAQLRAETAAAHYQVERALGLPGAITDLSGYRACLQLFYRLYLPLEISLASFGEWASIGIRINERTRASRLAADLHALGIPTLPLPPAPQASLPALTDFAHALGALYVLEGSTLGSQFILRHLASVLGAQIAGADTFFCGSGPQTGAQWALFQTSLNLYGASHPASAPAVVQGAAATFGAIEKWMVP